MCGHATCKFDDVIVKTQGVEACVADPPLTVLVAEFLCHPLVAYVQGAFWHGLDTVWDRPESVWGISLETAGFIAEKTQHMVSW